MMKYVTILSFAFLLVLSSCQKNEETVRTTTCLEEVVFEPPVSQETSSICSTDICMQYLEIWKELIREKNNLSDSFFDTHIKIYSTNIHTWKKGDSFQVSYEIQIDWAIIHQIDSFIININSDDATYPLLDLPRDTYLNKAQVEIATDNRAFSSNLAKINDVNSLQYATIESALKDLIEFSGVNTMCASRMVLDKNTGNLTLEAIGQYENEENSCIHGSVDLVTEEKEVSDTLCFIIG